ncbi:invasion associated locus B family protein [Seohaeicola saemankumensis]|nr:invasion associated locus B family protein [Seohaeicola saemankumensis]MCA0873405.1 invasion associated locus B family protein [Seohaeicola saemankumensis]
MFKSLLPLSALAFGALASAALAQDTTTGETPAEAPTASDQLLDLGQPVGDGPQLGERYAKSEHGDWTLACIKTEAETDPCSLLQILKDETGNPVAEVSLFRLEGGGQAVAGATVIVPLETLLPAQLTVSVDGAPGKRYGYSFCNPIGCIAQIGLTAEDIAAFKKGNAATVSLVPAPAPDQRISLSMSLKGFTAGYDTVDVVSNN